MRPKIICVMYLPPQLKISGAIAILLLFVIGFNPSNIYAILCSAPAYAGSSILPYMGYWIKAFIRLLILVRVFFMLYYFLKYFITVQFVGGVLLVVI